MKTGKGMLPSAAPIMSESQPWTPSDSSAIIPPMEVKAHTAKMIPHCTALPTALSISSRGFPSMWTKNMITPMRANQVPWPMEEKISKPGMPLGRHIVAIG